MADVKESASIRQAFTHDGTDYTLLALILLGFVVSLLGRMISSFARSPMAGLIGLVIAWQLIPIIFVPIYDQVLRLLYSGL